MSFQANIPRRYSADDLPQPSTAVRSALGAIWNPFNSLLEWFGELGMFIWHVLRSSVRRPFEGLEQLRQLDEVGSKSLPLVVMAGAVIGAVLTLERRHSLLQFGAKSVLPAAIVFSITHETGRRSLAWWRAAA